MINVCKAWATTLIQIINMPNRTGIICIIEQDSYIPDLQQTQKQENNDRKAKSFKSCEMKLK